MIEPDSSSQVEPERNQVTQSYTGQMGISTHTRNGVAESSTTDKMSTVSFDNVNTCPTADNTLSSTTEAMNIKNKIEKVCRVCGDKAKSFHFGGLSCDSCKAFFRRSVHNSAFESFQCTGATPGIPCHVSLNSRKSCQFCRFQKCISIGMEKKWVMSEEERSNLNKQRKEKKDEKVTTTIAPPVELVIKQPSVEDKYEPDISEMLKFMTIEERDQIESVVQKYQHSYREMPFSASKIEESRNPVETVGMFTTILRRFAYFAKLLPEFCNLCIDDQSTLLRGGVLEMCLLRSALAFDIKNNRWPRTDNAEFLKDCPKLKVEDMERLVSKELFQMHMKFINGMQELKADEPVVMVLLLIVLFHPERGNLQDSGYVSEVQEKYIFLLNKYTQWRYGPTSSKAFPKLLTKLADLRELNDFHTEYNLKMSKKEVDTIQEQLGQINLNPYPQWVLVQDQRQGNKSYGGGGGIQQKMREAMMGMGGGGSGMPSTRELFMNFVNSKIPALIENPFVPMDVAGEMAASMAGSMFQLQRQQQQHSQLSPTHGSMEMGVGEIPNLEYQFLQGQHMPQGHDSTQIMEEFLQSDRAGVNTGIAMNIHPSFFTSSGGQTPFYGHHNFMGMGQQTMIPEQTMWENPSTTLHEEFTFPDPSAMLHPNPNTNTENINHNWRNTQNY